MTLTILDEINGERFSTRAQRCTLSYNSRRRQPFFFRKDEQNTLTNINLLFIITVVKAVSQFPFFNRSFLRKSRESLSLIIIIAFFRLYIMR